MKYAGPKREGGRPGLPSCEGSGLKCSGTKAAVRQVWSPLMRGEWIEIAAHWRRRCTGSSPLMRGEWIEISASAAALRCASSPLMRGEWIEMRAVTRVLTVSPSPLMRGEWIEMTGMDDWSGSADVSPHARGVD